jgi:transcription-repair coupling factor (superfamily II helicase)
VQLDLCQLLHLVEEMPVYRELLLKLKKINQGNNRALILDAAKPYLIASLYQNLSLPMIVITSQPENAKRLYEQISMWCSTENINLFPEPDMLAYERTISDFSIEQERLQVLNYLSNAGKNSLRPLIISSAPALLQKSVSLNDFVAYCLEVKSGADLNPLDLMSKWEAIGYQTENIVEVPGTMSRRGGILDIFPPNSDLPVRLEFFGNTIESIRLFDPASQRSRKVISKIFICPATEILPYKNMASLRQILDDLDLSKCSPKIKEQFEQDFAMILERQRPPNLPLYSALFNTGNLIDYLPENSLVIIDEVAQVKEEIEYINQHTEDLRTQKIQSGELPSNFPRPYHSWIEIEARLKKVSTLNLFSWTGPEEPNIYQLNFSKAPDYTGQLQTLISRSKDFLEQNFKLLIISNQASRLSELFEAGNIYAQPVFEVEQVPKTGSLTLIHGSLSEGWQMGHVLLLTDRELFGFVKERRFIKKRPVHRHKLLVDIKPGDYVVHVEHGIGIFKGVINMSTDNTQKEYLLLTYADGDQLYVPTDQLERVNRYIGSGESEPRLSRLGTQEWNKTKQKVKESAEEIAQDLLHLYATREVVSGYAFSPDNVWQQEMEASFPYIETPDQVKVQEEVKQDMAKVKPMDRLIIGDVGYGKTEIAIRAAFKAVMDNKQVAVLVPTTILAEQHYLTFKQRMGAFPVKIETLSRFRSPKQQKKTIEELADGSIDICIGTHRLLQKDVVFKDLGLIIIDEEQRFGVSHKEYLKKLRQQVDVLTLSATPIPRTLHMSLVGVRDMSVIETPPENRLPIKSYIAEYNDRLVREAILREIERNGQVFFVHNRVQGIASIAEKLHTLVPEARINIAHGQIPEEQLEEVMSSFQKGESDVLICTTIIESGLDLPNANTLIVNHADKFGLTQLYQLRGRIGRGSNLAYAYFLYDKEQRLTPTAESRLRTIFEATDLGAGFGIAMKDLEIRGAGTLLGTKQSGSISAVGFNLYTQLLAQAVEEEKTKLSGKIKSSQPVQHPEPNIDLPLKAYLPDDYIVDVDLRLSIYQKLSRLTTEDQVNDLTKEIEDRFGDLPVQATNLLYAVKLKTLSKIVGIESISTNNDTITIRIFPGVQFNRQKLSAMYKYGIKIGISQLIISIRRLGKDWPNTLECIVRSIL